MTLAIKVEPGEEEAALAFMHEKFPQTAPLVNLVSGGADLEADLLIGGKTIRVKLQLQVNAGDGG